MTFKKKSEILECDPDVETKIHGHRIFYTYTTFYIEKKFFCFFGINREAFIQRFEVLSKETPPQMKKKTLFTNSISANSHWILMTTV